MAGRVRTEDLTPEALERKGQRLLVEGHRYLVRAELARSSAANDWVDQYSSPLGKRRHLELARAGKLPSKKDGRKVLVRREDLNAYLEKYGISRGRREEDEDVEDIIERVTQEDRRR